MPEPPIPLLGEIGTRSAQLIRPSLWGLTVQHRILVVDDDRDTADSLARLLAALDYEAQAVYSGREAIEQAATFHPDLAFIDIGMPDLDGYQTLQRIRQLRGVAAQTVLIALTGNARPEDKQRAYECGFDLHIAKPMSLATLTEVLALLDPTGADSTVIAQRAGELGRAGCKESQ